MKYEYKKGKFIKNGHTMFEQDVLQDLKRLDFLEKERTEQLRLSEVMHRKELLNSFLNWEDSLAGGKNIQKENKLYIEEFLKTIL